MKIATILTAVASLSLILGTATLQAQAKGNTPTPAKPPARVRTQLSGFDLSANSGKSAETKVGGASPRSGHAQALRACPRQGLPAHSPHVHRGFYQTRREGHLPPHRARRPDRLRAAHHRRPSHLSRRCASAQRGDPVPLDHHSRERRMLGGAPALVSVMIVTRRRARRGS